MPDLRSPFGIIQGDQPAGLMDLGPGYLDPALVPTELIARWAADALNLWGSHALAYGANAGPWPLRVSLAERLAGTVPMRRCGPANVMITAGTSAAIDHLAMRFAREGRILLTESLTYDLGRRIFTGWGVRTVAVPGPVDDLDVDQFRKAAEQAARSARTSPVIYLIPTFHNPTSRVLSAERRLEIVAMAQETDSLIVEDHAYSDLGYESSPPPPPLWNYGTDTDQVISLYSLSKCLAPGLRIGWLLSSECLVSELAECPVRASGGGPNHFAAMVVMAGLAGNQMDSHINILRDQMRMRRDSLIMPLMRHLPESCTLSWPTGGFFAWVSLPNTVSDETLLRDANRRGISFAAGNRFGVSPRGVRLCFARYKPEQLAFGAARFTDACRSAVRND